MLYQLNNQKPKTRKKKEDLDEEIFPITETTFKEMLKLKENVFTQEVIDKIEEFSTKFIKENWKKEIIIGLNV